jgi:V8-like Glu-specific endopeptidase
MGLSRRIARRLVCITATVAVTGTLFTVGAGAASADPPAPPGTPTATSFAGVSTVGPIFRQGVTGRHGCTGSVVASPTRDLVLTAAHCVTGTGAGYQFAPGYDNGSTPFGVWTVTHAYLDPSWIKDQDPQHDYALLQVAYQAKGRRQVGVQDVAGANLLGTAPRTGDRVTDVAYNAGTNDQPIKCSVPTYATDGYPAFNCHGYVGGSSGSPWLSHVRGLPAPVVRGVIGGLHQGGCFEYTSYSSAFRLDVYGLLYRAVRRIHPDTAPVPGSDGC